MEAAPLLDLLLRRLPSAAAVLTVDGRIERANAALAAALGAPPEALVGADLVDSFVPAAAREDARSALGRAARRGHGRMLLGPLAIPALHLERVDGARGYLLATATGGARCEVESFEMKVATGEFGVVLRRAAFGAWLEAPPGVRCEDLSCGGGESCGACPAKAVAGGAPSAEHVTAPAGLGEASVVVKARASGEGRAIVTVMRVDDATRAKLVEARLEAAASRAGLSDRERQVLHRLLLGGELAEIAAALGITHRTVRFHQYNLFEKLGARSRAELAKLLL